MTEKPYKPAPLTPCPECPWRVENVNRPAPQPYEDSFTRAHHLRCLSDLRGGNVCGCHLTGSRGEFPHGGDPRWIEAGFQEVPEAVEARECAGSVAAALREVRYLSEAGSFDGYHDRRPQGLTRETAALWVARLARREAAGVWPKLRRPIIDESAIIDPVVAYDADPLELMTQQQLAGLTRAIDGIFDGLSGSGAA